MVTVQQTPDLRTRQIALEEESLTLGIDRYQKERERQDEADTGPGRHLIQDTIGPVFGGCIDHHRAHCARRETILVESNFGDGMFVKLLEPVLRRIYPCTVEEIRSTGQKERRIIDTLEPVLNNHRLVVDAALLRADEKDEPKFQLFHQLTRITRDRGSLRHDDRLDALAMAVAYWTEWLSRDVTKEEDRRREELMDEEYLKFEETVLGRSSPRPNFFDYY
jgi:hypothetical protein